MKILIGSDIVPTHNHIPFFEKGEIDNILDGKIIDLIDTADFRIYNLEFPFVKDLSKEIDKWGKHIQASNKSVNLIKKLRPNLLLLANNHISDYGIEGLENTIEVLNQNNIKYTGIINSCNEEYSGEIIELDGKKIGIYNVCENEFSVSTIERKGTNGLNMVKNCREIMNLKSKVDYLIVLFHGGKEFYRFPSPLTQRRCRDFIDSGADMVIMQHSHCIGCEEIYNNKRIVYGQGNFIFDRKDNEFWNSELLIEISIEDKVNIKYYPIEKVNGKYFLSNNSKIIDDFNERSNFIKNPENIYNEYKKHAIENFPVYLKHFYKKECKKNWFRKIFRKRDSLEDYSKKELLAILNFVECEAHRELLIQGIKEKINEK